MNIDNNLRHLLENETKIHLAEIRFLYQKLDRQLGLNGARVPITFGFDTDRLGAYTPGFGQDAFFAAVHRLLCGKALVKG